jgi:hypothetical protein
MGVVFNEIGDGFTFFTPLTPFLNRDTYHFMFLLLKQWDGKQIEFLPLRKWKFRRTKQTQKRDRFIPPALWQCMLHGEPISPGLNTMIDWRDKRGCHRKAGQYYESRI